MRPTLSFLIAHPSHFIALGFGAGLSPKAPGTAGTLLAWLLFPLVNMPTSDAVILAMLTLFFIGGIFASQRTGSALGESDHGAIVWDEMVATWLVLLFAPSTLIWQAVAVVLFRVFDIWKPEPIRSVERRFKGGFGVMIDDLLAAAYAVLVLAILVWLFA